MNKERRAAIAEIRVKLWEIWDIVDNIRGDEEEYRDNIPENLQGSERYFKADDAVENLESAADAITEALDYLEEARA